jgi:hypothetical protein
MARVRAKVVCFVDNGLRKEGEVFEYNGPHNGNLEYIDKPPVREEPEPEVVPVVRRRGRPARDHQSED